MKVSKTGRGFIRVEHPDYPALEGSSESHLVGESSIVGRYSDAFENPGSSALWIGQKHHLNREQVAQLVKMLQHWLDHKRLPEEVPDA